VGGLTFAWYTSKDSVTNTFQTAGSLKTVVVENFTPPTNWQPGVTTDKVVQVTNTGTVDAYTRVQLSEDLTFYSRDKAVALTDNTSVSSTGNVTVNKEAIVDSINGWTDKKVTDDADFVKLTSDSDYATLLPNGLSLAAAATDDQKAEGLDDYTTDGLHLWVKESTGNSQDTDATVTETGTNLEFLGYYVKSGVAYEILIEPSISYVEPKVDDENPTTDDTTGKSKFTDTIDTDNSSIAISVYSASETVVSNADIANYVEIEFADNGKWFFNADDNYFYYTGVLASGATTEPLIKAVRLKDNVGDEMINATYNLKVYNDSTQATDAAADSVFATSFSTNIKGKDTNITPAKGNTDCTYSVNNSTVCSATANSAFATAFNAGRMQRDQVDTSTSTVEATTTATAEEATTEATTTAGS
jgi:alternate signal-mediated exported protein